MVAASWRPRRLKLADWGNFDPCFAITVGKILFLRSDQEIYIDQATFGTLFLGTAQFPFTNGLSSLRSQAVSFVRYADDRI